VQEEEEDKEEAMRCALMALAMPVGRLAQTILEALV
jgi:hypothetical protein